MADVQEYAGSVNTVIFDLDGTLLNTIDDLMDSVNHVLSVHGMPVRSKAEITAFVGNGVGRLMELSVPEGTKKAQCDELLSEFCAYYSLHGRDKTAPYEGITDMLAALKRAGLRLAVVSNKIDSAVKELCNSFFGGLLELAVGEHENTARKPAPDMLYEVLEHLGAGVDDAVYVGDSEVDIATAEAAGMRLIMVEWGFRKREDMEKLGAVHFVRKPEEIADILAAGK